MTWKLRFLGSDISFHNNNLKNPEGTRDAIGEDIQRLCGQLLKSEPIGKYWLKVVKNNNSRRILTNLVQYKNEHSIKITAAS